MLGEIIGPIEVTDIAHGGHCVGRYESRVVFIRHAIPGETVMVKVTECAKAKFWRGDAVEVLRSSKWRVEPKCPVAFECGGCDFQHVSLAGQRDVKRMVVAAQLAKLAGVDWQGVVEPVSMGQADFVGEAGQPGDISPTVGSGDASGDGGSCGSGFGWRTRVKYWRDGQAVGFRKHRSHQIVDLVETGCLIAHPDLPSPKILAGFPGEYFQLAKSDNQVAVFSDSGWITGPKTLTQRVAGRKFKVRADGFWQIHPGAAEILSSVVLEGLAPKPGETALDLYCGVGLFAGRLADAGVKVTGVELVKSAIELAKRNVAEAEFFAANVDRANSRLTQQGKVDLIVLDPPRSGAGTKTCRQLAQLAPRAVAYVACDPASLARDVKTWLDSGYQIDSIRAFDLFPMTHHIECVCLMTRVG